MLRLGDDGACACLVLLAPVVSSSAPYLLPCTEGENAASVLSASAVLVGSGGGSGSRSAECVGRGARAPRPTARGVLRDGSGVGTDCVTFSAVTLIDTLLAPLTLLGDPADLPGKRRCRGGEPPEPAFTGVPPRTARGSARARGGGARLTPGVGLPIPLLLTRCVGDSIPDRSPSDDGGGWRARPTSQLPRRVRGDSARRGLGSGGCCSHVISDSSSESAPPSVIAAS